MIQVLDITHVQIVIIAAESHPNSTNRTVCSLIDDDLVVRVELLFLEQTDDFPNNFDILSRSISHKSSSSFTSVFQSNKA